MHLYGHEVKPGERKTILLPVSRDISLEMVCCCGERPGKTLVLTSGVHGCEYVGVETLKRLSNTLEPKKLTGNVVLLPIANPSGFFEAADYFQRNIIRHREYNCFSLSWFDFMTV